MGDVERAELNLIFSRFISAVTPTLQSFSPHPPQHVDIFTAANPAVPPPLPPPHQDDMQ